MCRTADGAALVDQGNVEFQGPAGDKYIFMVQSGDNEYRVPVDGEGNALCHCRDKEYNKPMHCKHELAAIYARMKIEGGE